MTHLELVPVPPVAQLAGVSQHYNQPAINCPRLLIKRKKECSVPATEQA